MGNKPSSRRSSAVRGEDEDSVHINMLLSDDDVFTADISPGIPDNTKTTSQQYVDNLKLFEKKARATSITSVSRYDSYYVL